MYELKGFSSIDTLVSNITGVVAPIGELSTYSSTFSKEKKIYPSSLNAYVTLKTFSSISSLTGDIDPPVIIINLAHTILDWIYNRQTASMVVETKQQFLTALSNNFLAQCDGIICGELVNAINGKQFPEWISWRTRGYTAEDNLSTIWLSDQSFRQKYDNYEITVVPPIDNLLTFFTSAQAVLAAVNRVSHVDRFNAIQDARDKNPETALVGVSFNWVDPLNSSNLINTNWSVLVYGPNGDDSDVIRSAIASYILQSNPTYSEAQWKIIFPDIFRRTEFLFFPRWHNYGIENMVLQAGIYSPVTYCRKEIDYLKSVLTDYPGAFVEAHTSVLPHPYKCLALDVIGGFDNRENLFDITQVYPDILNVSTTSMDYNRMSAETQGLLTRLSQMILVAESLTPTSDIPTGYRKAIRYGITFITTRYMNIELMVSSKLTTPLYS